MRILLVEDEPNLADLVEQALEQEGLAVDRAADGEEALDWIETSPFDAIVLDILLPRLDGLTVCRRLRASGMQTPVLMLTARDAIADRVAGLDAGADDYLVKPFAMAELLARLRALARRPPDVAPPVLRVGDLELDPAGHLVFRDGKPIALTAREFRILECLMRNAGRVLTRGQIAESVWDYDFPNVTNVIDVHIRSLRRKLDDPYPGLLIQTERGIGYRLATWR